MKILLRESQISFINEFFNDRIDNRTKKFGKHYFGDKVHWYGGDHMKVVPAEDVYARVDNIFDPKKMKFVENMIRNADDYVEFEVGYGFENEIEINEIIEYFDYLPEQIYGRMELSTGDGEVDEYLKNKSYFEDNYGSEISRLLDDSKMENDDIEVNEEDIEEYDHYKELETKLDKIITNKMGDIGRKIYQLRDGNHRTLGSIAAGERFVALNVVK